MTISILFGSVAIINTASKEWGNGFGIGEKLASEGGEEISARPGGVHRTRKGGYTARGGRGDGKVELVEGVGARGRSRDVEVERRRERHAGEVNDVVHAGGG